MPKKAIIINSSYNVHEWDDSVSKVQVTAKDNDTVTIEYEDGISNRVPIAYFTEELRASSVN
jgi:hypothetical protein